MPPVLITISGMVGTGKSTVARHLLAMLEREGVNVVSWRFSSLPCFALQRTSRGQRPACASAAQVDVAVRGVGYHRKPLTARATLGYALRMVSFRAFRLWPRSAELVVTNRYFYDNLAHYDLDTPRGRWYASVLHRLMPRPDLAILLVASPETIAARRPRYAPDYVVALERAYGHLSGRFPELLELSSDAGAGALERAEVIVRQRLSSLRRAANFRISK